MRFMIIPMLCVTIFVIFVVWFLLPRLARLIIYFFFLMIRRPRRSKLFPYPTLFRSGKRETARDREERERQRETGRKEGDDRKSTRLNSSHQIISYAVFCLKKKKK